MLNRKSSVKIIEPMHELNEYNTISTCNNNNQNILEDEETQNPLLSDNHDYLQQDDTNNENKQTTTPKTQTYHSNITYVNSPQIRPLVQNHEYNTTSREIEPIFENQIMKSNQNRSNMNKNSFKNKSASLKKALKTRSIIRLNKNKEKKMQDDLMAFSAMQQSSRPSFIIPNLHKKLSLLSKTSKSLSEFYTVELRAVFLKVGDIDTLNEKFYAEAFIEAKWYDPNLSPEKEYDAERDWNPKVYILNCLGDVKQDTWYHQYSVQEYEQEERENKINEFNSHMSLNTSKSSSSNNIKENVVTFSDSKISGSVIVERRKVKSQFWQTLDLKNFPCDIQQLTITLTSPKPSSEVQLKHCKHKTSSVNVKAFADSQEWMLYKHINVNENLRDSVFSSETYPALDLTINAARRPTFYYWNAFFLIFLITLTSLSIFSIKCHLNHARIQTTSTLLLTSVTFKWITNRSLPTVSYMTSLDKYSITCMLFICAQCVWHSIISVRMEIEQKCEYPFSLYDSIAFSSFCSLFLLIHFIFFCWLVSIGYCKRRKLNKLELDYTNSIIGKRSTRLKSMLYGI